MPSKSAKKNKQQTAAAAAAAPAAAPAPVKSVPAPEASIEDEPESEPVTEDIGEPADVDEATMARAAAMVKESQARQAESAAAASRGERKAKKAFEGLGLTPVSGINRVVFKRPRNELIVIQDPEVFKSATADVYIVYGQATMAKNQLPGLNPAMFRGNAAQNQAAQLMQRAGLNNPAAAQAALANLSNLAAGAGASKPVHVHDENCAHDEDDPADALPELVEDLDVSDDAPAPEGITEKEIEMVIKQSGASRGQAISAIRSNGGDVAAAIMQLTE